MFEIDISPVARLLFDCESVCCTAYHQLGVISQNLGMLQKSCLTGGRGAIGKLHPLSWLILHPPTHWPASLFLRLSARQPVSPSCWSAAVSSVSNSWRAGVSSDGRRHDDKRRVWLRQKSEAARSD